MRGSASPEVTPGGAAATSALSFRSSSVHNTAAIGFEFMCCLNLETQIRFRLDLERVYMMPLSSNYN